MVARLFGTDGFRGPYDSTTITGRINSQTFEELAFAYASIVTESADTRPIFVIGGDTRASTPTLVEAVSKGVTAADAEVWNVGISPTPMIAWLAQEYRINAIAITASHNPSGDNGFKPFEAGGIKPARGVLDEIEVRYRQRAGSNNPLPRAAAGLATSRPELASAYLDGIVAQLGDRSALQNRIVVVDGANGAARELAPAIYRRLGAEVVEFACSPKGVINKNCGAAHLEGLQTFLRERPELTGDARFLGAFANDGDADRVLGVDGSDRVVNGNHWMRHLARGQDGIVGTIYTNSALREAVRVDGTIFHECDNGDSQVTVKLKELCLTRGGEFTGHLIDLNHIPSGDGLYMGARLAVALADDHSTLSDAYDSLSLWPELLRNVRVAGVDGHALAGSDIVQTAIFEETARCQGAARIVLRPSGTEPLVRIWTEAKQREVVEAVVGRLTRTVQSLANSA
jgi:phosphoglucosamine mutase